MRAPMLCSYAPISASCITPPSFAPVSPARPRWRGTVPDPRQESQLQRLRAAVSALHGLPQTRSTIREFAPPGAFKPRLAASYGGPTASSYGIGPASPWELGRARAAETLHLK